MRVFVENEYDQLEYVLMAYPQNFDIVEVINKMQRKYVGKIDYQLANRQYNDFVNTLIKYGVKVQFLNLIDSPEQVFTRDIGFAISNILFISTMAKSIRKEEPNSLLDFVADEPMKIYDMEHAAEGGDVFVHNNKIFVGLSRRTSQEGIDEIRSVLQENNFDYEVIPIRFNDDQLHLDCEFNILDRDTCIISDQVYSPELIEPHFKNVIKLKGEEVANLATNFVHIGKRRIVTTDQSMANKLSEWGYEPLYIDYSEFIKSGGSVRCTTLPIRRIKSIE